jgi:cyclic dehypoxanthinyl futalosine synthase
VRSGRATRASRSSSPCGPRAPGSSTASSTACCEGRRRIDEIARGYSWNGIEDPELARHYLEHHIHYRLGADELRALRLFLAAAVRCGAIERAPRIRLALERWSGCHEVAFGRGGATDPRQRQALDTIADRVIEGGRIDGTEALLLLEHERLPALGALADLVRRRKHPDRIVTYIIDRNINYTNVCNAFCSFCAFYRPPHHAEGYLQTVESIEEKIRETYALGGRQVLLQGGHNPQLGIEYYEELFSRLKASFPDLWLHALSPPEIVHVCRVSRLALPETIRRLRAAGLDSVPGGGAEILVDRVRRALARNKCSAGEWLAVMEEAHRQGLRSTATMMFGHVETPAERIEHLERLRELQDRTGGFTAFIGWTYQAENTDLGGAEVTSAEYLRTLAVSRVFLDNIDNVQASWVTQGPKLGAASLAFGVNDMGSTMIEENVVSAAGTVHHMNEREIVAAIRDAGFVAKRRDMTYRTLAEPVHA